MKLVEKFILTGMGPSLYTRRELQQKGYKTRRTQNESLEVQKGFYFAVLRPRYVKKGEDSI